MAGKLTPDAARKVTLAILEQARATAPGDPESAHASADAALTTFLEEIGFKDIADAWERVEPKWFA